MDVENRLWYILTNGIFTFCPCPYPHYHMTKPQSMPTKAPIKPVSYVARVI